MTFNKLVNHIFENVQGMDTFWEDGNTKVTIKEVINYLDKNHIPVEQIKVSDLKPILINQYYTTSQKNRVKKANIKYPIIVIKSEGKLKSILDGNHRVFKAIQSKIETLPGRVLDLDNPGTPKEYKTLFDYKIEPYN